MSKVKSIEKGWLTSGEAVFLGPLDKILTCLEQVFSNIR